MLLTGKTALVTGAGSGIGRAVALAYARAGANLVVSDIDDAGGQSTVAQIEAGGGRAIYRRADVTQADDHHALVEQARRAFGRLDLACNNAGISRGRDRTYPAVADIAVEDWAAILAVNLTGVFYGLRAQIPAMIEAGGGAIVNIASVMGQVAREGLAAYVASKHGVVGLTRTAALDYAGRGVRVNSVGPGYIDTPILSGRSDGFIAELKALHPLGRLGRPEEVAALVLWLSSPAASFATGGYYPIDGGYLAQ